MRGGVFICYRREDSRESVFIDVDNIPAARDFVEVLREALWPMRCAGRAYRQPIGSRARQDNRRSRCDRHADGMDEPRRFQPRVRATAGLELFRQDPETLSEPKRRNAALMGRLAQSANT
jgi:hypothetical protein